MEQIKVLYCLNSDSWGGLEIYATELILELQKFGLSQGALCRPGSRVANFLSQAGVTVFYLPAGKVSKLTAARLTKKIALKEGFTHLHSHTRLDMWACSLAKWRKPFLKHIYNLYMNAVPKQDLFHRWLFSKIDALCVSSENILNDVKKNFPIPYDRLYLVRYGRHTEKYCSSGRREDLRRAYGVGSEDILFGTLCRIDPGKGVYELVKALEYLSEAELKSLKLWIVGDKTIVGGSLEAPLYDQASLELDEWINIKMKEDLYRGIIQRIPFQKDYIPYIEALDIFVLASYNETYSLSVIDGLLMSKPVIGTNAGGTPEQIGKDERGYLASPRSAPEIAEALRHYINNRHLISQQGELGREWALTQHTWKNTLKKTVDIYNTCGDHQ